MTGDSIRNSCDVSTNISKFFFYQYLQVEPAVPEEVFVTPPPAGGGNFISSFPMTQFVNEVVIFIIFIIIIMLDEGAKKNRKKVTNVSLYVCMSAGNSEMLVFLSVFFPTTRIFQVFLIVAWVKKQKKI